METHLNFKDRRSKTSKIEVAEPVTVDNIIIISCDQVLELIMNQEKKNAKLKTILGHSPYSSGSDKQDDSLRDLKDWRKLVAFELVEFIICFHTVFLHACSILNNLKQRSSFLALQQRALVAWHMRDFFVSDLFSKARQRLFETRSQNKPQLK